MLVGICIRICDSNIDYRFMLVYPQSSEEDITSVSIIERVVNRRIVFLNWNCWSQWDAVLVLG